MADGIGAHFLGVLHAMIRSMTAFAREELRADWGTARWEIRSVNNRYLDISPRLPEDLRVIETAVREKIGARLNRGKIDCTLKFDHRPATSGELLIDEQVARQVSAACEKIQATLDNAGPVNPMEILRWPGVVQTDVTDLDALSRDVLQLLDRAVDELIATRVREGQKIRELLLHRCDEIRSGVSHIREFLPAILAAARKRLENRLAELQAQLDVDRVEQEMVILLQKSDVAEELDRLEAHIDEVCRVLDQDKPVGRRLDFLMQELNREANTLGSKSIDVQSTRSSVDLKVLIEQMREQIQNLE